MLNAEFRMQNSGWDMPKLNPRGGVRRATALAAFCILHSALLLSLTGCGSKARAETLPDGPPLAVPVAPAHEIAIEQVAEAPPTEPLPAPEPPPPTPPVPRTAPPAPRAETPPPPTQPAAAPPQQPDAPVVRAAPAGSANESNVRALIKKAGEDLLLVDYKKLSKEGQAQYDQSKKFSDEANQAIKDRNLPYALTLAEKAANLAAELVR
jgi:hypothetical protein